MCINHFFLFSRNSFSYLFYHTFTRLDFYLLWLTRFLFLTVGCGLLAHWKTLAFTQSADDKMMSIAGGQTHKIICFNYLSTETSLALSCPFPHRLWQRPPGVERPPAAEPKVYCPNWNYCLSADDKMMGIVEVWLIWTFAFTDIDDFHCKRSD